MKLLIMTTALLLAAGCGGIYQNQTTVLGLEMAYNPIQTDMVTARFGVITHRQNIAAKDAVRRISNEIQMYDVNLWTASGTVQGKMEVEPASGNTE